MDWLTVMLIVGAAAAVVLTWILATGRGSYAEMPGGETIFGAPTQPERPAPHRTLDE